jgi:oxepin-CoA hydrolase / 3-oxo-5,6-dehydrosuberyl-CoA semialdehyde dehydrogenase
MIVLQFDVNDDALRRAFFDHLLLDAVAGLGADDTPLWGAMNAQHMLEHLQWAFACSTGSLDVPCSTPPHLLERAKRFLRDHRQTPHEFRNPLLGEVPPPFRYADFDGARGALQQEVGAFVRHFIEEPDSVHMHPLFGPLSGEEWQRAHFKHGFHHLLQFGLVAESAR